DGHDDEYGEDSERSYEVRHPIPPLSLGANVRDAAGDTLDHHHLSLRDRLAVARARGGRFPLAPDDGGYLAGAARRDCGDDLGLPIGQAVSTELAPCLGLPENELERHEGSDRQAEPRPECEQEPRKERPVKEIVADGAAPSKAGHEG